MQCQLYADLDQRVLICRRCKYALSTTNSQVTSHLRDKHGVAEGLRKGLTHYLRDVHPYEFRNPAKIPVREDGCFIHPELQIHQGFACRECLYRTINYLLLTRHVSKVHLGGQETQRRGLRNLYDEVNLQTWSRNASCGYWIVTKATGITRTTHPVGSPDGSTHLRSADKREKKRLEVEGQALSLHKEAGAHSYATTGPWMKRSRWHTTYRDTRRDLLQGLTWMPNLRCPELDHCIGPKFENSTDTSYVYSPWQDEHKLARLATVIDRVLDRCEETMQYTSQSLLRWLRSTQPHICYPKPFTLVAQDKSKKKYRQLWKRFLIFIFRLFRMAPSLRRRVAEVNFTKELANQLHEIWDHDALNNTRIISSQTT